MLSGMIGCGVLSASNYASSRCPTCDAKVPVVTDDPIVINYSWPESKDRSSRIEPHIACVGAPCEVLTAAPQYASGAKYSLEGEHGASGLTVIPKGAGSLTINLSLRDPLGSQSWSYGPLEVVAPDRIAVACASSDQRTGAVRKCDAAQVGDLVRIEISLFKGEKLLSPKVFGTISVDGQEAKPEQWGCAPSASAPEVTTCASGVQVFAAGEHTLRVQRGALFSEFKMAFN